MSAVVERLRAKDPQLAVCAEVATSWVSEHPYQSQALLRFLQHLLEERKGDCELPTGAGTTNSRRALIAATLIASKLFKNSIEDESGPTLYKYFSVPLIAPNKETAAQYFDEICDLAARFEKVLDTSHLICAFDSPPHRFEVHLVVTHDEFEELKREESALKPQRGQNSYQTKRWWAQLASSQTTPRRIVTLTDTHSIIGRDQFNGVMIYNFTFIIERAEAGKNIVGQPFVPPTVESFEDPEEVHRLYADKKYAQLNGVFDIATPGSAPFKVVVLDESQRLHTSTIKNTIKYHFGEPILLMHHGSTNISPSLLQFQEDYSSDDEETKEDIISEENIVAPEATIMEYMDRLRSIDWWTELRTLFTKDARVMAFLALLEAMKHPGQLDKVACLDTEFLRSAAGYKERPLEPCSRLVQIGVCMLGDSNLLVQKVWNVSEPCLLYHAAKANTAITALVDGAKNLEVKVKPFAERYLCSHALHYNEATVGKAFSETNMEANTYVVEVDQAADAVKQTINATGERLLLVYGGGLPDEYIMLDIIRANELQLLPILNMSPFISALMRTLERPALHPNSMALARRSLRGSRKLEFIYKILVNQNAKDQPHTAGGDARWLFDVFKELVKLAELPPKCHREPLIQSLPKLLDLHTNLANELLIDKETNLGNLGCISMHGERKRCVRRMSLSGQQKAATLLHSVNVADSMLD